MLCEPLGKFHLSHTAAVFVHGVSGEEVCRTVLKRQAVIPPAGPTETTNDTCGHMPDAGRGSPHV